MMARGGFSEKELEELNKNPYVLYAEKNKIAYSNAFKHHFMDELNKGKRPQDIFAEAGFDIVALGSKRMERATARWKESYAAGTLGNYNDSNIRKVHAELVTKIKKDTVQKKFDELESRIRYLEEIVSARDAEITELKKKLDGNVGNCYSSAELEYKNRLLRAEVEALTTIFIYKKDNYNYENRSRKQFYDLVDYLCEKYNIDKDVIELVDTINVNKRGYLKHEMLKNK